MVLKAEVSDISIVAFRCERNDSVVLVDTGELLTIIIQIGKKTRWIRRVIVKRLLTL